MPGRHHQSIGRSGKRRSETHACRYGHRKKERNRTNPYLHRALQGNRRHKHSRHRIADKHRHQRSGKVNSSHQGYGSVSPQPAHQGIGYGFGSAGFLQGKRHGKHCGKKHDCFPVNRLICSLHIAEAPRKHHEHGGYHHRRNGSHRNKVEHHHHHHQNHNKRCHRCLVIQCHLGGFGKRLPQYDPIGIFLGQPGYVLPLPLHKQHIAVMHPLVAKVLQDVFFLPADAQHIHIELIAETGFFHPLIEDVGGRHQHNFSNADVVKAQ